MLKVGQSVSMPFIVRSSSVRTTKTGKPFCSLVLWTGEEEIACNLWDHSTAPEGSLIMKGVITEWAGAKQLDCKDWREAEPGELPTDYFLPKGPVVVAEEWSAYCALVDRVQDEHLRALLHKFINQHGAALQVAPGAKSIHHAYCGGLLQHLVGVCRKALALGEGLNQDYLIAGSLLHDCGKLETYKVSTDIVRTDADHLMGHISAGILLLERLGGLPTKVRELLYNIILSHHGQLEWGSPVTPMFAEAWVVHLADMADSKLQPILEFSLKNPTRLMTDKAWPNNAYYTPYYVGGGK